jgi:AcrR family transcriptional regulator
MAKKKVSVHPAKERKITNGPIRNKERTRKKLTDAVGKVFAKEGYANLTAIKIASVAKVDRKLIYLYFGSLNNMIDCYFKENDFWVPTYNKDIAQLLLKQQPLNQQAIMTILKGQLDRIMNNKTFQKVIQWELSEKNKHMRKLSDERELVGEQLFNLTEDRFIGSGADLRATLALQIAGIYYLALHAKVNGSTFCGIDINLPAGKQRIENALKQIINDTFDKVKSIKHK